MQFKVDENLHEEVAYLFTTESLVGCLWIVDEIGLRIRKGSIP